MRLSSYRENLSLRALNFGSLLTLAVMCAACPRVENDTDCFSDDDCKKDGVCHDGTCKYEAEEEGDAEGADGEADTGGEVNTDSSADADTDADTDADSDADTDADSDADTDADTGSEQNPDTDDDIDMSQCDTFVTHSCEAMFDADEGDACIADFSWGTTQAGNMELGVQYDGFRPYNDGSYDGVQLPENSDSWPLATTMPTCGGADNPTLHFQAEGFNSFGAGVELYWGGPDNPDCDVEGAMDCYELYRENSIVLIGEAEADQRCQEPNAAAKLSCLTKGPSIKAPKDISMYQGIGFWILATEENAQTSLKITFPIADTTPYYGECSDNDDTAVNDCHNHFSSTVSINADEVNQWVYKEVLFESLDWNVWWGLQLDELGYDDFPADQSLGLEFQADTMNGDEILYTDLYIDDIILI